MDKAVRSGKEGCRTYLSTGLGDAEEGECKRKKTEGSKEDVCAPGDRLEHIRRDKANDAARQSC